MRVRVIEKPDGSVVIRVPNLNATSGPTREWISRLEAEGKTEDEIFDALCSHGMEHGIARADIDTADLPEGHEHFKAARRWDGGKVTVDMDAARTLHMTEIRKARDVELAKLDLDYLRADEVGDNAEKARVAAKKQKLRDIPTSFDLTTAGTPAELKALWPSDLS